MTIFPQDCRTVFLCHQYAEGAKTLRVPVESVCSISSTLTVLPPERMGMLGRNQCPSLLLLLLSCLYKQTHLCPPWLSKGFKFGAVQYDIRSFRSLSRLPMPPSNDAGQHWLHQSCSLFASCLPTRFSSSSRTVVVYSTGILFRVSVQAHNIHLLVPNNSVAPSAHHRLTQGRGRRPLHGTVSGSGCFALHSTGPLALNGSSASIL